MLIRMVAETAQYAGHADIIRELIDGTGGPDQDSIEEATWREYLCCGSGRSRGVPVLAGGLSCQ